MKNFDTLDQADPILRQAATVAGETASLYEIGIFCIHFCPISGENEARLLIQATTNLAGTPENNAEGLNDILGHYLSTMPQSRVAAILECAARHRALAQLNQPVAVGVRQ